ncbi:hypothetical protein MMC20_000351 [Loxospora ochrophaea]|nr:hypothetical protein [Loxospora ochrophaea]
MFNSNACLVADSKSHGSTGSGEPSKPNPQSENQGSGQKSVASGEGNDLKPKQKTMAEQDEELRLKLEGLSGDGGEAGVELEDGKPAAMKRSRKYESTQHRN